MRTFHTALAKFALVTMTLTAIVVACDDRRVYVYTGARYDEAAGCLESYSPIEVVPGEGASAKCSPRCVSFDGKLYISTVCPPLPLGAEVVQPDAGACAAALRALQTDASCSAAEATTPPEDASKSPPAPDADAAEAPPQDAAPEAAPPKDAGPG